VRLFEFGNGFFGGEHVARDATEIDECQGNILSLSTIA
jgi:hypothetical protein